MNLQNALQQPDKTRLDLEGVTITRAEMKTSSTGKTYHSSTIVDGDTKAYISFFGDYPGILNEPVTITKAEISTYNGKRSFTAGKFSKVSKFNGAVSSAPVAVPASATAHVTLRNSDGPVLGMCFKMAHDFLLNKDMDITEASMFAKTHQYKKWYDTACNSKPLPQSIEQAAPTEDAPF